MSPRHLSPALVALALLGATAACGKHSSALAAPSTSPKYSDEPSADTASMACGTLTKPDPAALTKLPSGFPTVAGFTPIFTATQGSTVLVRGAVPGAPAQIPSVRDAGFVKIQAKGYTVTGHDQEVGFEADGDFTGPHPGNINVKTLCRGYLVVTYTFGS